MAITTAERTGIEKVVIALFNASPSAAYLAEFTASYEATGRNLSILADGLASNQVFKNLYPSFQTAGEFATQLLSTYNLQTSADAIAFVTGLFNAGVSKGQIALRVGVAIDSSTTTDPAIVAAKAILANKALVADNYAVTLGGSATTLSALQNTLSGVTDVAATVTAANNVNANVSAGIFTLTTGIDNLVGGSGNDTFITDSGSLSAADSVNGGAGIDTMKFYGLTAAQATSLLTLSSVENLYFNGLAVATVDASIIAGVTGVTLDAQLGNAQIKITTGQAVSLLNNTAAANTTNISGNAVAAVNLTVTNLGNVGTTVDTLDLSGLTAATLNVNASNVGLTGSTAGSKVTLTNTGLALKSIVVTGAQNLSVTSGTAGVSSGVTTFDASAGTGNVSYNAKAGGAITAGFKFTGGAGNDTLTLSAGDIALLSAGTQLNGGAGTGDKLGTFDTTLAASDYAKINASTGFEVFGLNGAITVDKSQLTSINSFSLDTDAVQGVTAMATGGSVAITAAHGATISIAGAVGVNDLALSVGTSAASNGITVGGVTTIGQTTVALKTVGNGTVADVFTSLLNADNSTYTITGSNDLTITATSTSAVTGSKFDGSALTGKLSVAGNTAAFVSSATSVVRGDILIGGSAADTLKAAVNGGTLTGGAGNDIFDVSVAKGGVTATFQTTTITDLTKGDSIKFAAANGVAVFSTTKVDLSGAANVGGALDILAAGDGSATSTVKYGVYAGNTYIVEDNNVATSFALTDVMVKVTGVVDLSTSSLAGVVLTIA